MPFWCAAAAAAAEGDGEGACRGMFAPGVSRKEKELLLFMADRGPDLAKRFMRAGVSPVQGRSLVL